jgi:hypothetical protein
MLGYPPTHLDEEVDRKGWYRIVEGKGGRRGEIKIEMYIHDDHHHSLGLIHLSDPDRSFSMVADTDVLRQAIVKMLETEDWCISNLASPVWQEFNEALLEFLEN